MTVATVTKGAVGGPATRPNGSGFTNLTGTRAAYSVALSAVLSMVAGQAAPAWHLSVPFLNGFAVLLGMILLADHLTGIVGRSWHAEKIAAAPQLAGVEKVAEVLAEQIASQYVSSKAPGL